jgi:hypothetical protein
MKTGKSERDILLDQTLALVKAAIDHDSVSSSRSVATALDGAENRAKRKILI